MYSSIRVKQWGQMGLGVALLLIPQFIYATNNAAPVVNATISVAKTGSEPFDAQTWDGSNLATAGLDANEDNNVVRLQDSITYLVEASVNDNDVENLTATVQLDKKQAWIAIPTGCKTDPAVVSPVSTISTDKRTLFCNMGSAMEGTTRAIYPTARAIGASYDGMEITLNDHHVSASVSVQADNASNVATAGPTDVVVTANFKVNTYKELQSMATDPVTGQLLYKAPAEKGKDSTTKGAVVEYVIKVQYQKGSMIADAPNEVGGDFEMDYLLLDHYTDDNNNNNSVSTISSAGTPITVSTSAALYDWDPAKPACELVGDHGSNASVTCTQVNHLLDRLGPAFATDGIYDPNIAIDLKNIDVRDPDKDGNLVEVRINIWYSEPVDIATHQTCPPYPCSDMTINSVGVYSATGGAGGSPAVLGFNPTSTEDASGNNLANYNGVGEPFPEFMTYPLQYSLPGGYSESKGFYGPWFPGKTGTRKAALGDTVPFLLNVWDYRYIDDAKSQVCDKIDTSQFEYVGLAPSVRNDLGYSWNHLQYNPNYTSYGPTQSSFHSSGADVRFFYSADPHAGLTAQRDETCDDDVNGDGKYVLDGINQVTGLADSPNDWVTDPALLGGAANVSKLRMETRIDKSRMTAIDPANTRLGFSSNHLLKIKPTATGYTNTATGLIHLPNYITRRLEDGKGNWGTWIDTSEISVDPNEAGFSLHDRRADRIILVPSSISVEKYTEPRGIKVVRGGDRVDFIIEPRVFGGWNPSINTATVDDSLPAGTAYQPASERFSIDGGVTWLTYDQYVASNPMVTLTTPINDDKDLTLAWHFGSVDSGEQLPLIRYSVNIDPKRVSGNFTNTVRLNSAIGVDDNNDGVSDTKMAAYQVSIFPDSGVDVFKSVAAPVYSTNAPFEFSLTYKSLGSEDYGVGDFIDILPYSNDGNGQYTSGLASTRRPGSRFNGDYAVTKVIADAGVKVFATGASPTSLRQDPCHESNQPSGYTPVAGDVCYLAYVNNGNRFTGGSSNGTGTVAWTECTALSPVTCGGLDPTAITGLRLLTPALTAAAGARTFKVELTPQGNVGGIPQLDTDSKVMDTSTGDIYTNSFGGRVPELSLLIISNDVSVTVVSGSIGDYVWLDMDADGVQDGGEQPLDKVVVQLLNNAGEPVYVDPATGGVVASTVVGAIPYQTETNAQGVYTFTNLPMGSYKVNVIPPVGVAPTFDNDGGLDNQSAETLSLVKDAFGRVTGVEQNTVQDFGYRNLQVDVQLLKTVDKTSVKRGETAVYTLTVSNAGPDTVSGIKITDLLPLGVAWVSDDSAGAYDPLTGVWTVGGVAKGGSQVLNITVRVK